MSTSQGASYSVEVPGSETTSSYLRVGEPDQTSSREVAYYGDAVGTQAAGVVMWVPGDIVQVSKTDYTMKTGGETLAVTAYRNHAVNVAYTFVALPADVPTLGTMRDVAYKLSHSTSYTYGISQTWKFALNSDVAITNDQKIAIGGTFNAKLTADTTVALGSLTIASTHKGVDIKSKNATYSTNRTAKLEASDGVTIAVSPLTSLILADVQKANNRAFRVSKWIAATGALLMPVMGAGIMMGQTSSADDGKTYTLDNEARLKTSMKLYDGSGSVQFAMMTIVQAMFVAMGCKAIVMNETAALGVLAPKIVVGTSSIELSVGPSTILMDETGIQIKNGPSLMGVDTLSANLISGASSMRMEAASMTMASPEIEARGATKIKFTSAVADFA